MSAKENYENKNGLYMLLFFILCWCCIVSFFVFGREKDLDVIVINNSFLGYYSDGSVVFGFYDFSGRVYACPMVQGVYDCDYFMVKSDFDKIIEENA